MNEWIDELADVSADRQNSVLVTIAGVRGSAPREVGAKMIVTESATIGTIGGGQLEYQCARIAVRLLGEPEIPTLHKLTLGSSMGQCCGGVVDVLFEPMAGGIPAWLRDLQAMHGQRLPAVLITALGTPSAAGKAIVCEDAVHVAAEAQPAAAVIKQARALLHERGQATRTETHLFETIIGSDLHIAVFGAGHVGTAVVRVLAGIDCNVRWIDSRRNIFRHIPANTRAIETDEPALEVAAMPHGSCYLVMTHSHAIDYSVCERMLSRDDAIYLGLIGSVSKRRRFEKRLRQQGMASATIGLLVCPIGVDGIGGKKPSEIAVAAVAQILQARDRASLQLAQDDNILHWPG